MSTIKSKHLVLVCIYNPLGIAILLLALLRLFVRWRKGAPALPANMPEPIKLAAALFRAWVQRDGVFETMVPGHGGRRQETQH